MAQQQTTTRGLGRAAQLLGLLLFSALLAFAFSSAARAQETVVRMELDAPVQPIPAGEEFEVLVLVEDVEHLAAFDFTITYDPKRVKPVEDVEAAPVVGEEVPLPTEENGATEGDDDEPTPVRGRDIGQFLTTGERGANMFCNVPLAEDNTAFVSCVTLGPPVCMGGAAGSSGSGLLGRVVFKSRGGGITTLELTKTTLVLDDTDPCDPGFSPQQIPHSRGENITVELIGGGGPPWVIIGSIIGVVVLLLIGGGLAGYLWYQRRGAGTTP